MMRKISLWLLMAVITMASCKPGFKKGTNGREYKIISNGNGKKVTYGKFIQFSLVEIYSNGGKDSVINVETNVNPDFLKVDSMSLPPDIIKIFTQLHNGDSLAIRISTDTIFKQMNGRFPPNMPYLKKGGYLYQTIRILNIFDKPEEIEKILKNLESEQLKKDDKILQEYLSKNKIQATKSSNGTYVQILKEGNGSNLDSNCVAYLRYTGKFLDGRVFDSNMDTTLGTKALLTANLTSDQELAKMGGVIEGFKDGLTLLKNGSKAILYIPSPLGYGRYGMRGSPIKPNSNLIFEIEVVEVLSKAEAKKKVDAERKKAEEENKRLMDSIQKASKDTSKLKGK